MHRRFAPVVRKTPPAKSCRARFSFRWTDALVYARRFRVRWPWEVARYLVHGILHLEGCEDSKPNLRRAMKRRENKLLKELSRRLDLGKLEG